MIHWTRQIKEVLNAQETVETGDSTGPLEELSFWSSRCSDLSGISQQLQQPGVTHIRSVLQICKSSYVTPFCKLAKQIQVLTKREIQRERKRVWMRVTFCIIIGI